MNPARSLLWVGEQAQTAAPPGLQAAPAGPASQSSVIICQDNLLDLNHLPIIFIITSNKFRYQYTHLSQIYAVYAIKDTEYF